MLAIRFAIIIASFAFLKTVAFGYSLTHDYYNRYRPQYGGNVYVSQQLQYGASDATAKGSESVSSKYSGYVLQTSAGVEHFRFLQTGLFYSNVQSNGNTGRLSDFRGHEGGAEVKVVLQSPVVNVVVGGGAFYSSKTVTQDLNRVSLSGEGFVGSVELAYYASSNISLVVSGKRVVESLRNSSANQNLRSLSVSSNRLGAGISIWL